ncbi:DNA cytosine methyltransferase [Limosilactobacillus vaginalis]|uniref:DNA cytosine methyltransferase n=1 Tax=Limosilactobacillus vaginalis TaxID=1633 RepID=UPI003735E546
MMKKFESSLNFSKEKVKKILFEKINEEKENIEKKKTQENIKKDEELISKANKMYNPHKINIVSLFSGAGGLDLGVLFAGISVSNSVKSLYSNWDNRRWLNKHEKLTNIIYSNDLFASSNATYSDNFAGDFVKDDRDIREVLSFPKADLMLGGFPCPGFSVAGPRLLDDPRNFLYIHYIRALIDSKPKFFIAENVKGLMTMAGGKVLTQIKEDFTAAGYHVEVNLVNAKNYGVPQSRERVFIIGIRNDLFEQGVEYHLPEITNSNTDETKDDLITLKESIVDLPVDPEVYFEGSYSSMYMSRNRKKAWNDVSFTIQASARQAPQYPGGLPMKKVSKDLWKFQGELNRRLSVRECARIQTFPDWFEFSDDGKDNVSRANRLNEKYKQIGNAVPVMLAEKITRPVMQYLSDNIEQ